MTEEQYLNKKGKLEEKIKELNVQYVKSCTPVRVGDIIFGITGVPFSRLYFKHHKNESKYVKVEDILPDDCGYAPPIVYYKGYECTKTGKLKKNAEKLIMYLSEVLTINGQSHINEDEHLSFMAREIGLEIR